MSASPSFRLFDPSGAPPGPQTLEELCQERLAHYELRVVANTLSIEALNRIRTVFRQLCTWVDPREPSMVPLGSIPVTMLHQRHFTAWLLHHLQYWKAGCTKRDKMNVVLSMMQWGKDEGFIESIPWQRPKEIRCHTTTRDCMLPEHYLTIMKAAMAKSGDKRRRGSLRLRQALFFLWHTGCRPQTMRELKPGDIIWEKSSCRLPKHKTKHLTGKDLVFGVDDKLYHMLKRLVSHMQPGQEYVFLNNYGTPWDRCSYNRCLVRYARGAGVPKSITSYTSRHGFGCEGIRAGENMKTIADQMGLADTRMLEKVYASHTRYESQHTVDLVNRMNKRRRKMPEAEDAAANPDAAEQARRREADQFPLFEGLD